MPKSISVQEKSFQLSGPSSSRGRRFQGSTTYASNRRKDEKRQTEAKVGEDSKVEAAKCGVPSWSQGRPRTAADSRVESSGGVGKRDGSVPQLREEVQRDCRQAAHNILREQGQADAQDEH